MNKINLEKLLEAIKNHANHGSSCIYFENNPSKVIFLSQLDDSKEPVDANSIKEMVYLLIVEMIDEIILSNCMTASLHYGLSGVGFSLYCAERKFPELHDTSHLLKEKIKQVCLTQIQYLKEKSYREESDYDLIQGIAGILIYVMLETDDREFQKIADSLVSILVNWSSDEFLGFRIEHDVSLKKEDKYYFENYYNLGNAHGLAGVCIALASYYEKMPTLEVRNLILQIFELYKLWFGRFEECSSPSQRWPYRLYVEKEINNIVGPNSPYTDQPCSWCYGTIGILHSLFYSAILIMDKEEIDYWIKKVYELVDVKVEDFCIEEIFICHGYAGLLMIFQHFYQITNDIKFDNWCHVLEAIIMKNIECFDKTVKKEQRLSILDGTLGINAIILSYYGKFKQDWKRVFGIW